MKPAKRFTVRVSQEVKAQIREQVMFIATGSLDNALAWEDRVRASIKRLGEFSGHAVDKVASDRLGLPVRKVVFEKTYLIFYRVNDEEGVVEVINFRHGARLPRTGEP